MFLENSKFDELFVPCAFLLHSGTLNGGSTLISCKHRDGQDSAAGDCFLQRSNAISFKMSLIFDYLHELKRLHKPDADGGFEWPCGRRNFGP